MLFSTCCSCPPFSCVLFATQYTLYTTTFRLCSFNMINMILPLSFHEATSWLGLINALILGYNRNRGLRLPPNYLGYWIRVLRASPQNSVLTKIKYPGVWIAQARANKTPVRKNSKKINFLFNYQIRDKLTILQIMLLL